MKRKNSLKRFLAAAVSGVMLCMVGGTLPGGVPDLAAPITAHATDKTADEAISWVKSQLGKTIESDGSPVGSDTWAQCVDLVQAYYRFLGVDAVWGNGGDYSWNDLPEGWSRIEGAQPEKGDILVYVNGGAGHVGIYESDFSHFHQNLEYKEGNHHYVEQITSYAYNGFNARYWGVVRPNFLNVITGPEMTEAEGAGQTIPDGTYWIKSHVSDTAFVDPAPGNDVPAASSSNVAITDYKGALPGIQDAWTFEYLNNNYYKITQAGTDMCLDVWAADNKSGTNVQLYPWHESPAQMWSVVKTEYGYRLRSKCNSFSLDVHGGGTESGTNVEICVWYGTKAQLYDLIPFSEHQFKGKGTKESPYEISSAEDLRMLSKYASDSMTESFYNDKYYIQTADIDLKNESFNPIGRYDDVNGYLFSGHYNGNNHCIKNLKIDCDYNYSGLFGYAAYNAVIENLVIYGDVICPTHHHAGGIAGGIGDGAIIRNCAFIGNVSSVEKTGGITASVFKNGTITNCYFNGTIASTESPEYAGGIVGYILIGSDEGTAKFDIKNCYSAINSKINGGIIGLTKIQGNGAITGENNYYLKSSASAGMTGAYTKGCAGVTEEMMKLSVPELLGSPFVENTSAALNDGYPIFEWQVIPAGSGDLNADGKTDVTDLVLLQKWILKVKNTTLKDADAADLNGDGVIDVFDLALLKRKLLQK
ncbi:MAG: RICIN domain-containing protein [Oscillospiraceae bacterium]|nr:RICIN domain-containing protein [Oscillospiraceae bacterium]